MGIGVSIFIFAVGAVLRFAVTTTTRGFDVHTVGVILMFVGGVGFLLSLLFWSTWAPWGNNTRREEMIITDHRHVHDL